MRKNFRIGLKRGKTPTAQIKAYKQKQHAKRLMTSNKAYKEKKS
jgi:hypothetical protein